jgi:hypothetical protein
MTNTEKFLNPDIVKSNLILSALYLAAYELLKDSIVDRISGFFTLDYQNDKPVVDKRYNDEVLSLHKDLLQASCMWLEQMGAITKDEVEEVEKIRKHRNEVAHELPRLLIDSGLNLNIGYFVRIKELLEKIEVWWVKNFDIPVNPDFDGVVVEDKDIQPGRVIALNHLISVALSDYLKKET